MMIPITSFLSFPASEGKGGIVSGSAQVDQVVDMIINGCEPMISPESYVTKIDGKSLAVIEIPPGTSRPYYLKGGSPEKDAFLRTSASNSST